VPTTPIPIDPELLGILCCPETHQPLTVASPQFVEQINQRIRAGQVIARSGRKVTEPIQGGLLRQDRQLLYPIRHHIPILLFEEALEPHCSSLPYD
jgi:uncharacterized protein